MTYTNTSKLDWGKFRGKLLAEVPEDYLIYLYNNHKKLELGLKQYIKNRLESNQPK